MIVTSFLFAAKRNSARLKEVGLDVIFGSVSDMFNQFLEHPVSVCVCEFLFSFVCVSVSHVNWL